MLVTSIAFALKMEQSFEVLFPLSSILFVAIVHKYFIDSDRVKAMKRMQDLLYMSIVN